ncbi:unnamed protein product [Rhizoctonia solani]|uniref:Uncharacterized protein n=1 Tax=Rhizoctonia solani TaxID=456999 RepID=A0A8H3GQG1_9AGAM|nr:unnamed protein product [Rhizoctonia solani]
MTVLCIIEWKYRQNVISPPHRPQSLFRADLDPYMLQLLFGEIIMSASGLIDAKCAIAQKAWCSTVYQVQSSMNVIGVGSVAAFTSAITIYAWWIVYRNGAWLGTW